MDHISVPQLFTLVQAIRLPICIIPVASNWSLWFRSSVPHLPHSSIDPEWQLEWKYQNASHSLLSALLKAHQDFPHRLG